LGTVVGDIGSCALENAPHWPLPRRSNIRTYTLRLKVHSDLIDLSETPCESAAHANQLNCQLKVRGYLLGLGLTMPVVVNSIDPFSHCRKNTSLNPQFSSNSIWCHTKKSKPLLAELCIEILRFWNQVLCNNFAGFKDRHNCPFCVLMNIGETRQSSFQSLFCRTKLGH
jgi:hypothetical protein